ncbi:MAG: M24 family metallopeptidase [Rhizobiaceae bacterium]|nr:aminopeptidase P family protein [Hyphomicrobiales bacterium]NRB32411.1 M24 family metallopeptidase [Rhizobiaceae bacterium]
MNIHTPNLTQHDRPDFFRLRNGEKAPLPFEAREYEARLAGLRATMEQRGLRACVLTSMHCVAYYSGFLYCAFGRPYACVVTADDCVTVSANIDAGQPWRRCYGDNLIYTDWQRDNYFRAIASLIGYSETGQVGVEFDHLSVEWMGKMQSALGSELVDIAPQAMAQRMIKSPAEIELIKAGARVADIGGAAIHSAIAAGASEVEIAQTGRLAMEQKITELFPDSELRDCWVWFQSGLNTDGAHNPLTCRRLEQGDILSLNTFPMINGYYTALERTLFLGEPSQRALEIWQANVAVHERGLELLRPGAVCSEVVAELNDLFAERDLLQYRSFGYGHSFGVLSHYYGREAGLELREDNHTVLQPGMVVSMEPMLLIPEELDGAGGYREHDILVIGEQEAENITHFPYGPDHNIIA